MDKYIYLVISLSVISSVLRCFADERESVCRYSMFCVGVVCACILISPFNQLVSELKTWFEKGKVDQFDVVLGSYGTYESFLLETADEELRRSISELAEGKFGISVTPRNIIINYDTEDYENVRILDICIDMRDAFVISNVAELSTLISQTFMCKCEVLTV